MVAMLLDQHERAILLNVAQKAPRSPANPWRIPQTIQLLRLATWTNTED